jgi:hypothetical protein
LRRRDLERRDLRVAQKLRVQARNDGKPDLTYQWREIRVSFDMGVVRFLAAD